MGEVVVEEGEGQIPVPRNEVLAPKKLNPRMRDPSQGLDQLGPKFLMPRPCTQSQGKGHIET